MEKGNEEKRKQLHAHAYVCEQNETGKKQFFRSLREFVIQLPTSYRTCLIFAYEQIYFIVLINSQRGYAFGADAMWICSYRNPVRFPIKYSAKASFQNPLGWFCTSIFFKSWHLNFISLYRQQQQHFLFRYVLNCKTSLNIQHRCTIPSLFRSMRIYGRQRTDYTIELFHSNFRQNAWIFDEKPISPPNDFVKSRILQPI